MFVLCLDYVPIGPRFSNHVLQSLLVLLKKVPPNAVRVLVRRLAVRALLSTCSAAQDRRIMIICTTSEVKMMTDLQLMNCFNVQLAVPTITEADQVKKGSQHMQMVPEVRCVSRFVLQSWRRVERKWMQRIWISYARLADARVHVSLSSEWSLCVVQRVPYPIGIKSLLMLLEMAAQTGAVTADSFARCVANTGLDKWKKKESTMTYLAGLSSLDDEKFDDLA